MSDAALRELARRWRATGDPADEARLLAERLRAGELTRERLELAAFAGHLGARQALGDGAPAGRVPLRRWIGALDEPGRVALVTTALDELPALLTRAGPLTAAIGRGHEALREWCGCPCTSHADALSEAPPLPDRARGGDERAAAVQLVWATLHGALQAARSCQRAEPGRDAELMALAGNLQRVQAAPRDDASADAACALVAWCLGPDHARGPRSSRRPPDAAARYLADRVRRGDVSPAALDLAAYAGDAVACAALGRAPDAPADLRGWLEGLAEHEATLPVRALARLGGLSLGHGLMSWWFRRGVSDAVGPPTRTASLTGDLLAALRALADWSAHPAAVGRERLERAAAAVDGALAGLPDADRRQAQPAQALRAALHCALGRASVESARELVLGAVEDEGGTLTSLREAVAGWALE